MHSLIAIAVPVTFDPLSANFFHEDHPELSDVDVVYWFSLASQPVIIDANMKYVFPNLTIAGASTRFPPSSFHEYTSVVGLVKSSDKATIRRPCLRCFLSAITPSTRHETTHILSKQITLPVIILEQP